MYSCSANMNKHSALITIAVDDDDDDDNHDNDDNAAAWTIHVGPFTLKVISTEVNFSE